MFNFAHKFKVIQRVKKIIIRLAITLISLVVLLFILFQFTFFQTFLARVASAYLSSELNTTIYVEKVRFHFLTSAEVEGLYIEDQNEDTLFYSKHTTVALSNIGSVKPLYGFSFYLDSIRFKLNKREGEAYTNLQFVIDYFNTDSNNEESSPFLINQLEITNSHISFHDVNVKELPAKFNLSNSDWKNFNLGLEDILISKEKIELEVFQLSYVSDYNFKLNKIKSKVSIEEERIELKDLEIKTPYTKIFTQASFITDSYDSYSNFIEEVYLNFNFDESEINLKDLAYFVPDFNPINKNIKLEGKISGTIYDLSAEDLYLEVDQHTHFKGEFDLKGLPEIQETFIYLNADKLVTSYEGIKSFPYQLFHSTYNVELTDNIKKLGSISFDGNFTGFVKDFVAYGKFQTDLGRLNTDISLSSDGNKVNSLNGSISSKKLMIGEFLGTADVKSMGFELEINGMHLSEDYLIEANGKIVDLSFKEYSYEDIELNGTIAEGLFKGAFSISDDNVVLNFDGEVNTAKEVPFSNFSLIVEKANLEKLGLTSLGDSLLQVSFNAICAAKGSNADNITGDLVLQNINLSNEEYSFKDGDLALNLSATQKKRNLLLESSYLDLGMEGIIYFSEMIEDWEGWLSNLFFSEEILLTDKESNYSFKLMVKDFKPIQNTFISDLRIDSSTLITGRFNGETQKIDIDLASSFMSYKGFLTKDINLKAEQIKDSSQVYLDMNLFEMGDAIRLGEFTGDAFFYNDKGAFNLDWFFNNDSSRYGTFNFIANNLEKEYIDIEVIKSFFTIGDSIWKFEKDNRFIYKKDSVAIENFSIKTLSQGISLNGVISTDPSDSLILGLNNIDLRYLNQLLPGEEATIEGFVNGNASFKSLFENPLIESDILIKDLTLNSYFIEEASLNSYWNKDKKSVDFSAHLGKDVKKYLNLEGRFLPFSDSKKDLEVYLDFNHFPVGLAEKYIQDYLTDVRGALNGRLEITGSVDKPLLNGSLSLDTASFHVDYLNTSYQINDRILIKPDFIGFDLIKIKDEKGYIAEATGTIFHDNFNNFSLDIDLNMDKFLVLNTNKKSNDLYFGRGIVSGNANISGYADQLNLELDLTTLRGTDISIPLSSEVEVSENDFLIFTNSPELDEDTQKVVDLSGLGFKLNLAMNSGTKVKILFDESIGDKIFAEGKGNLEMSINPVGDFDMFGQFEVEEGDYTLTFKNLVNKKLEIVPGSKMMWDGDPYQARMDIEAIYNLRASPYALMPEDSSGRYKRRVPVELELELGGFLLTPDIDFEIRMPTSDEFVKERLRSILYVNQSTVNEQELNQQVFGLLVLNRFMPPTTGDNSASGGASGAGINNGYELLSNQLSSWLSSTSDAFDIGVAYRPANEVSDEEVDVSLTTEVFNDRLVLDSNLGYTSDEQAVQDNRQSNFVGEFMAEYKVSKDGRLRVRGFNRAANNDLIQVNSPYTQGVGISYREEFNKFSELKENRKKRRKEKEEIKRNDKGKD